MRGNDFLVKTIPLNLTYKIIENETTNAPGSHLIALTTTMLGCHLQRCGQLGIKED